MTTIILPGLGGSGEAHWQTKWEQRSDGFVRFRPASWDEPELANWIAALDIAVSEQSKPPFLVAHSLTCLLVAHWAAGNTRQIAGAFLVAMPDPRSSGFPGEAASFANPPLRRLPFPALLVQSSDDPYGSLDFSRSCASAWGAGMVVAGDLGHINASSRLGDWPQGFALFESFKAAADCSLAVKRQ